MRADYACLPIARNVACYMLTCSLFSTCVVKQKNTQYKHDASWKSWLALVEVETYALRDQFDMASIRKLDQLQLAHIEKFQAVAQYSGAEKPKHYMRANYPVDIWHTGPLIRSWCMTFEAMLQVLKHIASNSNYKNVCMRMVRIVAIRQGLMLYDQKVADWNQIEITLNGSALTIEPDGRAFKDSSSSKQTPTQLDRFYQEVITSADSQAALRCALMLRAALLAVPH